MSTWFGYAGTDGPHSQRTTASSVPTGGWYSHAGTQPPASASADVVHAAPPSANEPSNDPPSSPTYDVSDDASFAPKRLVSSLPHAAARTSETASVMIRTGRRARMTVDLTIENPRRARVS